LENNFFKQSTCIFFLSSNLWGHRWFWASSERYITLRPQNISFIGTVLSLIFLTKSAGLKTGCYQSTGHRSGKSWILSVQQAIIVFHWNIPSHFENWWMNVFRFLLKKLKGSGGAILWWGPSLIRIFFFKNIFTIIYNEAQNFSALFSYFKFIGPSGWSKLLNIIFILKYIWRLNFILFFEFYCNLLNR
jgi:hypothetical protein